MTHESEANLAQVIATCAALNAEVLSVRHEVVWPDGRTVGLHPVRVAGETSLLFRALHRSSHWVLFSLQQITPLDIEELKTANKRDQPGTVIYALRKRFVNVDAFLAKVSRHTLASWPGGDRPTTKPVRAAAAAEA
jgi:hypothetical protein